MKPAYFRNACLSLLLLLGSPVHAIEKLQLLAGDWQYAGISASNSQLDIQLTEQGLQLALTIAALRLTEPFGELRDVDLRCPQPRIQSGLIDCSRGQMSFNHAVLGRQTLTFSIKAEIEREHYQIAVSGLRLDAGTINLEANLQQEQWQAKLETQSVSLDSIQMLAATFAEQLTAALIEEWLFQGALSGQINMTGKASEILSIEAGLELQQWSVSDPQSRYVTEAVDGNLQLKASYQAEHWRWSKNLKLNTGQAYFEPVFIDFDQAGVQLENDGQWWPESNRLALNLASFQHAGVLQGSGTLLYQEQQVSLLELKFAKLDLAGVYNTWMQPFLLGTAADSLLLNGQITADISYQFGQSPEVLLQFSNVDVQDQQQRFSLAGLNGQFAWTAEDYPLGTVLRWDAAHLYALPIGAAAIEGISKNAGFRLTQPLMLPVLDGELQIHDFSLGLDAQHAVSWQFDGLLTPVSMQAVSEALGWPTLFGMLSGVIPQVRYQYQQVHVDGALMLRLFDGITVIRDLRLQEPLGALPQLSANIDITGLDLELLTQAFDFGRISGRLDGRIHDLRLADWQPVQFDAHFATPAGDRSRRRISQQAVDNLSQIGGGASGILSRSFLRFFEDFSYQQLGLSCRLQNSVCEMSGVADAEHGYYIVQGGGILPPWINVVGYTRRVDWPDLLERLQAVRHSSGPVIE